MRCPSCSIEIADTAMFCKHCGAKVSIVSAASYCTSCGANLRADAQFCESCGEQMVGVRNMTVAGQALGYVRQDSFSQGLPATLPSRYTGWNWGAFVFSWIWAIVHNTWIGLLALIPYVGLVMSIILGIKGNEWAWQNRRWESVEQFVETQTVWTRWALAFLIVGLTMWFLAITLIIIGISEDPRLLSE